MLGDPAGSGTMAQLRLPPEAELAARALWAAVGADAVLLGKFDRPRHTRLRGFYVDDGLTVRIQPTNPTNPARDGITRCVRAAETVSAHRPHLIPAMRDHGTAGRGRHGFLVENTVDGRTPRGTTQVAAAMAQVAAELFAVQQAVGIGSCRLSEVTHPQFLQRWQSVAAHGHIAARIGEQIEALITRDALLEVSFTHGDLVSSNVVQTAAGPVLIDWEYAGDQPIAFDLAKMHVNAGDAGPAVEALDAAWQQRIGHAHDHYSVIEQLALAHAVVLSRHEARAERAELAGRSEPLTRQTRRRARAIEELLALADARP